MAGCLAAGAEGVAVMPSVVLFLVTSGLAERPLPELSFFPAILPLGAAGFGSSVQTSLFSYVTPPGPCIVSAIHRRARTVAARPPVAIKRRPTKFPNQLRRLPVPC